MKEVEERQRKRTAIAVHESYDGVRRNHYSAVAV